MLYPYQRALIEDVFGCRVLNRYGALETGWIACECEKHTGLHISAENVYLEVLRDGLPVPDGEAGAVVVTNLNNYGFPFIRYCLGDVARKSRYMCPCGRGQPMLEGVEGRVLDMFRTRDGRLIWGGAFVELFEVEGIRQFQVVQQSLGHIVVRVVRGERFPEGRLEMIGHAVNKIMGEQTTVRFEFPEEIPLTDAGKWRFTISEIRGDPGGPERPLDTSD
jgi:phenylacetate-CoA ligase